MSAIKELESFIHYCTTKNQILSKNIANVGTKDYKREDLIFKDILADAQGSNVKVTNKKHIGNIAGQGEPFEVKVDQSKEPVSGVNNVDIEEEMAKLAENTINFKFASRKISSYYKSLQAVITGGNQ